MKEIYSTIPKRSEDESDIRIFRTSPPADKMHRHAFFELVYVMHGSAVHRLGADSAKISAGDFFIVDMGSFHCYRETDGFEIVNCLFLPEYVDRALINCPSLSALLSNQIMRFGVPVDIHPADKTYHDADGTIRGLICTMEEEFQNRPAGYIEMIRCCLTTVLVRAARLADCGGDRQHHPAVAAMAEYLSEHSAEPLSLTALSERLGYTPQYLSKLFRKESGMSLSTYLQRLRVENACVLLSDERLRIAQIAQKIGYGDQKHFNAVFRCYKNMSPREFRTLIREKSH